MNKRTSRTIEIILYIFTFLNLFIGNYVQVMAAMSILIYSELKVLTSKVEEDDIDE